MKVAIAISGNELARDAIVYDALMHVDRPPDTIVMQARSSNIAENRNGLAERALALGCDAIWYVDDDQVFAPDTLLRLLARDKDVISGLYVQREAPFTPHVYDHEDAKGYCKPRLLKPFEHGLVPALATGAGCLLVKTAVFRAVEPPYWRLGQITKDGWGDDLHFCHRVRDAGFSIWCDLDVLVGHVLRGVVWPVYQPDGQWMTALVQRTEPIAVWPAAQASPFVEVGAA